MNRSMVGLLVSAAAVFAAGLLLDRLTKVWAIAGLSGGTEIPLLPTISLRLVFNPGAAFGLGAESGPITAIGILVVLTLFSAWILWTLIAGKATARVLLLVAAAAGGWGNMLDRITRAEGAPLSGTVVDFISVDWFAIFNGGDVLAVCGLAGWALLSAWRRPQRSGTTPQREVGQTDPPESREAQR